MKTMTELLGDRCSVIIYCIVSKSYVDAYFSFSLRHQPEMKKAVTKSNKWYLATGIVCCHNNFIQKNPSSYTNCQTERYLASCNIGQTWTENFQLLYIYIHIHHIYINTIQRKKIYNKSAKCYLTHPSSV